jgi:hypothetical protein
MSTIVNYRISGALFWIDGTNLHSKCVGEESGCKTTEAQIFIIGARAA